MSGYGIVQVDVLLDERLSPSDRLVYTALTTFADKSGRCNPGAAAISKRTGLSTKTVYLGVGNLERFGILSIERRYDEKTHRNYSNEYALTYGSTGGTEIASVGVRNVGVYPMEIASVGVPTQSACNNTNKQDHVTKDCENPNAFPSKEVFRTLPLSENPSQETNTNEQGDMEPEAVFEEKVRADFKDLVELFPKKEGASKKAFALYKAFFSRERQHFKRNDFRATNVFSAVEGYRRSCEDQEQRFIKSLSRFLEELDPDQEVTEIVTVYGQRKAS